METVTEVVKNMAGGDGEVTIKRILGEKELNGKCGLYAQVTIQPNWAAASMSPWIRK